MTTSAEVIASFELPSEVGNERQVMGRVSEAVAGTGLDPARLARLETAVSEAAMNAIEHGNEGRPELPVRVEVLRHGAELVVRITDRGSHAEIPSDVETPDLQAKLDGLQSPRGWGLFLIKEMVDDMRVSGDHDHHVMELVVRLEGASDG